MKKLQFLLLDAGPIIKLFELGIWETFIEKYEVAITRTVVEQCIYTRQSEGLEYIDFPFEQAAEKELIKIVDVPPSEVKFFDDKFKITPKYLIHPGEDETLAYFLKATDDYAVCAADKVVFIVLGLIGKGEQGISLEELLNAIGLGRNLEWRFTKKFREKYTLEGKIDAAQGI
jgi:glutathione peroxidase-family protein